MTRSLPACLSYPPYPQATHDALKLLKTGMELNNNAEEGRTAEARRVYSKLLEQTLAQEMSIVNSLRQASYFYEQGARVRFKSG